MMGSKIKYIYIDGSDSEGEGEGEGQGDVNNIGQNNDHTSLTGGIHNGGPSLHRHPQNSDTGRHSLQRDYRPPSIQNKVVPRAPLASKGKGGHYKNPYPSDDDDDFLLSDDDEDDEDHDDDDDFVLSDDDNNDEDNFHFKRNSSADRRRNCRILESSKEKNRNGDYPANCPQDRILGLDDGGDRTKGSMSLSEMGHTITRKHNMDDAGVSATHALKKTPLVSNMRPKRIRRQFRQRYEIDQFRRNLQQNINCYFHHIEDLPRDGHCGYNALMDGLRQHKRLNNDIDSVAKFRLEIRDRGIHEKLHLEPNFIDVPLNDDSANRTISKYFQSNSPQGGLPVLAEYNCIYNKKKAGPLAGASDNYYNKSVKKTKVDWMDANVVLPLVSRLYDVNIWLLKVNDNVNESTAIFNHNQQEGIVTESHYRDEFFWFPQSQEENNLPTIYLLHVSGTHFVRGEPRRQTCMD